MNTQWRIELFGGLRAARDGRVLTRFGSQKSGALLAYLAYYHPRTHPREILIELLLPDGDPEVGRHHLSVALSALRHELESADAGGGTLGGSRVMGARVGEVNGCAAPPPPSLQPSQPQASDAIVVADRFSVGLNPTG